MSYTWIVFLLFAVIAFIVVTRFKNTKLLSKFPFSSSEKIIFTDEPASLAHKQATIVGAKKK